MLARFAPSFQNRAVPAGYFLPRKALLSLCPFFILRKRQRCSWEEPWMSEGAWPCCCHRLSFELLFIIYVCCILNRRPLSFPAPVTVCLWHSRVKQVIYLFSSKDCSVHHGILWPFVPGIYGRITSYANKIAMLHHPLAKDVSFTWMTVTLCPLKILWESPQEQASVPQHILWTWECWLIMFLTLLVVCTCALTARNLYHSVWMYFKAVGRKTKDYENRELNGPLYVSESGAHPSSPRKYHCKNQQFGRCSI